MGKKDALFDIKNLSHKYGISEESLQEAIRKIYMVDHDYLKRCVDLYETIANYSKEMGLKYIAQQKLSLRRARTIIIRASREICRIKNIRSSN